MFGLWAYQNVVCIGIGVLVACLKLRKVKATQSSEGAVSE